MVVPVNDLVWQQGEDSTLNLVYKVNDVPVDLTGYELRMDVRDGTQLLYTFNSSDVAETTDQVGPADNEAVLGSDGTINITVPRSTTLDGGAFINTIGRALKYDVFLRSPENKQTKILKGTIIFEASETRWL